MDVPFHIPDIREEDVKEVVDTLRSGWITTGPRTKRFEEKFAAYVGGEHAVAVNSCTAALHLALEAVGVGEGDTVLTTPMTFAATAEVVRYLGARPVFVDIEADTLNIDPVLLEEKVRQLTAEGCLPKAVIPVHYGGHPCEMDPIMDTARGAGMKVVEDAAHMLPGAYRGRSIGTIGDVTCFSFYATKNITTGEGGMAVTEDEAIADRMRTMSLHGISKDAWKRYTAEGSWYYEIVAPGYKYNMTDIAAAMGLKQLERAEEYRGRREDIAERYTEAFSDNPALEPPSVRPHVLHSWHLYPLRLNLQHLAVDRNTFIEKLRKRGIGVSVHFIPLHLHPYYRKCYGYRQEDFPRAMEAYQRLLSLPLFPTMTEKMTEKVIEEVLSVAGA